MNSRISKITVPLAIAAVVVATASLRAQTFTVLTNFPGLSGSPPTNTDGGEPDPALVLSGNRLYGTAEYGGTNGQGTAFSINIDGSGYSVLRTFTLSDGASPADLLLSGPTFYTTGAGGGTNESGSVISFNTNGTGLMVMHSFAPGGYNAQLMFTNQDGAAPWHSLVLAGSRLYGVTAEGTTNGSGTVFSISTDSIGFKTLHVFGPANGEFQIEGPTITNEDGYQPNSTLVLVGDTLYGATAKGSTNGWGTLFSINTNGDGFKVIHTFSIPGSGGVNPDGVIPTGLTWSGSRLCGTTQGGGTNGWGVVFAVDTSGSNYTVLHTFATAQYVNSLVGDTNADGAEPMCGLTVVGNTFYGTTSDGGIHGDGTLFSINWDGSGFTLLHTMAAIKAGVWPEGEFAGQLVFSGNALYGTAFRGGPGQGNGTIFRLTLPAVQSSPELSFVPPSLGDSALKIVWPDSSTGFTPETTGSLSPGAAWTPLSNNLSDDGTNYSLLITNTFDGTNHFYRLHGSL